MKTTNSHGLLKGGGASWFSFFGEGAALETASVRPPCPFPMKRVQVATELRNAPYRAVLKENLGLLRDWPALDRGGE